MQDNSKQVSDHDEHSDSDNTSSVGNLSANFNLRGSSRGLFLHTLTTHVKPKQRPDVEGTNSKLYKALGSYKKSDEKSLLKDVLHHHEHSLGINFARLNLWSAFNASCLAIKDRVMEQLNDVQHLIEVKNCKRAYFLSSEYLVGRLYQHILLNLNIDLPMKEALKSIGVSMEDVAELEADAGFGSAGLGRYCACMLDSFATLNLPVTAYGVRYNYGSHKQLVVDGNLYEVPDAKPHDTFPWEIERTDVSYRVSFGGTVDRIHGDPAHPCVWKPATTVEAKAYDIAIPGFGTTNTVFLRQWKAIPDNDPDPATCAGKDYYTLIKEKQEALYLTWMLYPNPNTIQGIELKLRQEYFFVSASIQDIIANYKKSNSDFRLFATKAAVHINDTQPALAVVELLRILIDEEHLEFDVAWTVVVQTFSFTNHSVLANAVQKWDAEMLGRIFPRHLELVYLINHLWLEKVKLRPDCSDQLLSEVSLIEEQPNKKIRMAALCVHGSHMVNGVSEVHTQQIKSTLFKAFADLEPEKFTSITNGCSIRRWICDANPALREFYNDQLGSMDFVTNYSVFSDLEVRIESQVFQKKWFKIKRKAKARIVAWIEENFEVTISEDHLFDGLLKKVTESKRQLMFLLFIAHRYLVIKKFTQQMRERVVKRVFFLSGKPGLSDRIGKSIVEFGLALSAAINGDRDVSRFMKLIYVPNYNVSVAEVLIPGMDLSEHISVVGTEASGTSNMKAALNGAIIIGSRDGANLEIAQQVKANNIYLFGIKREELVEATRKVR